MCVITLIFCIGRARALIFVSQNTLVAEMTFSYPTPFFFFLLSSMFLIRIEAKPGVNVKVKVGVNGKQIIDAQYPNKLDGNLRLIDIGNGKLNNHMGDNIVFCLILNLLKK